MLASKRKLIADELAVGTGADISVRALEFDRRTGLMIWFSDLDEKHGPITILKPHGLKSHAVRLSFGQFSARILQQIATANAEDVQLARALVKSAMKFADLSITAQTAEDWLIKDGNFEINATFRHEDKMPDSDDALIQTCREVIVPIMAAMAELIGYDVIDYVEKEEKLEEEGKISQTTITRRERNPRNRLLCIRFHGEKCFICGLSPKDIYKEAGSIIEVHHLEPVATLSAPRPYNPETELIPLCPNCHRAVHTRKPLPIPPEELLTKIRGLND
ncbi:HNH endonuclease [Thalassospira sp. CH_XMU1448-2]|uniref:HNH endonuclease n=1 Tax=Thalassospira sp. CH_XMU1448-2 TaxID=3107773 RepID=UPI00300964C4